MDTSKNGRIERAVVIYEICDTMPYLDTRDIYQTSSLPAWYEPFRAIFEDVEFTRLAITRGETHMIVYPLESEMDGDKGKNIPFIEFQDVMYRDNRLRSLFDIEANEGGVSFTPRDNVKLYFQSTGQKDYTRTLYTLTSPQGTHTLTVVYHPENDSHFLTISQNKEEF
jgi:hypothetical protein